VVIDGNRLESGVHDAAGVLVSGGETVAVGDNQIVSSLANGYAAIAGRATNQAAPFALLAATANRGSGWQRSIAISGNAPGTAKMTMLAATDNALGAPMSLDDGSGALLGAAITVDGVPDIARWPADAIQRTRTTLTMTRPAP